MIIRKKEEEDLINRRQVPKYVIVGNGRVARHISFYFWVLDIEYTGWIRDIDSEEELEKWVNEATHVLVLISDREIEGFIQKREYLKEKILIHFSGSLETELAYGVHPLYTFEDRLYNIETYGQIPFVYDADGPDFNELFPELPNKSYRLEKDMKAKYHALCVMSNNFTTLLWRKFYEELEDNLNLPKEVIHPYLEQTLANVRDNPWGSLTGPFARGDWSTVNKNLKALERDVYHGVYEAFVEVYKKAFFEKPFAIKEGFFECLEIEK